MEAIKCRRGHYYDKALGNCPVCAAESGRNQSPFIAGSRVPDSIGMAPAAPSSDLFDIPATMPASSDFEFPAAAPADNSFDYPATMPATGNADFQVPASADDSFDYPATAPAGTSFPYAATPSVFPGNPGGTGWDSTGNFTVSPTASGTVSDYAPTEAAYIPRTPGNWEIEDYGQTLPAMMCEKAGFDPVVGWLICVKGPNRGRDYRLHSGSNFIGRSKSMDVCIENDQTISNRNHASVSYDERSKTFYIAKGEVRNLIYLNGKPVRSDADLVSYDRIEIGNTELLFVALCSDRFNWQDA